MDKTAKRLPVSPVVRRRKLQANLDHVSQEMYLRNRELAETNKTLSLLRTIDAMALESHASLKMACRHITEAITQATDYPLVGLFTRSSHTKETMTLHGWSGKQWLGGEVPLVLSKPLHLDPSQGWLAGHENKQVLALNSSTLAETAGFLGVSQDMLSKALQAMPIQSIYVVKLHVRRRLVGLLVAGFYSAPDQLKDSDTLLLDRLSDSVGVALDNKLLFEENQRVLRQMQEANAKLRALDETKDDFISMASHQLRTPLTSIKGYLSMVLEEDAGKLNDKQQEMLNQAYVSSQRMVYLIADLLNVSRLKNGKFMIQAAPVNLADMVDEELRQLYDTAKSSNLQLTYDKPANFPSLDLDETKTRQVIMNFVDNAIYYTPAGGEITVSLIEKPHSIELRVTDSGIGVPKSERAHLFTKFYRADNARKARPDGTGLGLFMAKKVVIAQGGAIIFETTEGKGSTFGFMLPKPN